MGRALDAVTGTRLWLFIFSLPGTVLTLTLALPFCFTRLQLRSLDCCCYATVRTLLRSPTGDGSNTASFLAGATMARFLPLLPPRSASFRPQRRRSQSTPNGPRMCCAPCTKSVRKYVSPSLLICRLPQFANPIVYRTALVAKNRLHSLAQLLSEPMA